MPAHRIRNHPLLGKTVELDGVKWTVKEAWLGIDGRTDYVGLEDDDGGHTGFTAEFVREMMVKAGQGAVQ